MPKPLRESTPLVVEATPPGQSPTRRPIQIITPGWGSSGYYSPQVLEAAARDRVIPAGTHMYLNHASATERKDRPERDVEKIAAVLVEDATWDGTRLLAEAELVGPHAELINSLAPYIGLSISGSATDIHIGEAEGRTGPIIDGLAYVESVDFVTHAGRGGMVLLESARPSLVNARAIGNGVAEATANDTREQLQQVLRDTFGGEQSWVWVRDFDETTVWYEHETPDATGTFAVDYEVDDADAVTLSGTPVEVRVQTTYVPVARPGSTTTPTEESQEDTMPQIEEARLRQLEEAAGRVTTLEAERDAERQARQAAERRLAEANARDTARATARRLVLEANGQLPLPAVDRIVTESTRTIPLTADGVLDDTALAAAVTAARTAEEAYLTTLAESTGAGGRVTGFGASTTVTESTHQQRTANPWGRPLTQAKGA